MSGLNSICSCYLDIYDNLGISLNSFNFPKYCSPICSSSKE